MYIFSINFNILNNFLKIHDSYDIRNYTDTSLISDTYKGKLCAKVKCLNCANISIIEEDFMGISLNIPEPVPYFINNNTIIGFFAIGTK